MDSNKYGFYRFAAVCPKMKVADTKYNTEQILDCIKKAFAEDATTIVFPELCITGYTCNDLFHQELLLQNAEKAIEEITDATGYYDNMIVAVGAPFRIDGRLYNCAIFMQSGSVIAVTPKIHLPNQREFYEKRYFSSGADLYTGTPRFVKVGHQTNIPVTNIIKTVSELVIGCELCEDLWVPNPPSGILAMAGANVIVNLSASDALVGKANYRRDLVCNQSARCMAGYVYASAGVHESTTDMVCSGHLIIAENGSLMAEKNSFSRETEIVYADIDVQRLNMQRISEGSFQNFDASRYLQRASCANYLRSADELKYRYVAKRPFVPSSDERRTEVCSEIFNIQCAALAKRLEASNTKHAVVGLSGGLDSTLALLVIYQTYKLLKRPVEDILAITMPGFGTTKRTKGNAEKMAECLGVELRTIDITDACRQHFNDIGHDPNVTDVTYENVQARERTQILMDVANKEKGIVIGTGDLSELALGWCHNISTEI
jgi:NAD+ synthase (glutamine-hydrolysing)